MKTNTYNRVCILGGSGFVGHHLAARLAQQGKTCRILTRRPHRHRDLQVLPGCQLVEPAGMAPEQLAPHFAECDAVINLLGILNESGTSTFRRVHVEMVEAIVEACRLAGIPRLLHMSALHASQAKGSSEYLRTKGEGEGRAHHGQAFMAVTSFRPSVIFGAGDSFFNRFATLLRLSPVMPLACPDARFQPVYVGDVADAFIRALNDKTTWNQHYDLCGPDVFTLRQLVEYTAECLGLRPLVLGLNDKLSRLQARVFELVPGKPLSYDNYLSLRTDSTCVESHLAKLGIEPQGVENIVPLYLQGCGQRERYQQLRKVEAVSSR